MALNEHSHACSFCYPLKVSHNTVAGWGRNMYFFKIVNEFESFCSYKLQACYWYCSSHLLTYTLMRTLQWSHGKPSAVSVGGPGSTLGQYIPVTSDICSLMAKYQTPGIMMSKWRWRQLSVAEWEQCSSSVSVGQHIHLSVQIFYYTLLVTGMWNKSAFMILTSSMFRLRGEIPEAYRGQERWLCHHVEKGQISSAVFHPGEVLPRWTAGPWQYRHHCWAAACPGSTHTPGEQGLCGVHQRVDVISFFASVFFFRGAGGGGGGEGGGVVLFLILKSIIWIYVMSSSGHPASSFM